MTTNNEAFKAYLNKFKHVTGGLRVYSELNEHEKSIAKDAWQAATTEANKRIAELELQLQNWKDFSKKVQKIDFNDYLQIQASNHDLREALDMLVITKDYKDKQGKDAVYETMRTNAWNVAQQALSTTPAESLQAHDDEVAKCKVDAERYQFVRQLTPREFAEIYDINLKSGVHFDHLISQALKEVK